MEHEHVLSGLLRKRAELAGELEALQARAHELIASLSGLDATIRLFAPGAELDAVGPRRPAVLHAALPGQTSRAVLDALRDAPQPLTTRELALQVMAARDLNTGDHALFLLVQKRVLASLRNLRMRGLVRSDRQAGSNLRWKLAEASAAHGEARRS